MTHLFFNIGKSSLFDSYNLWHDAQPVLLLMVPAPAQKQQPYLKKFTVTRMQQQNPDLPAKETRQKILLLHQPKQKKELEDISELFDGFV